MRVLQARHLRGVRGPGQEHGLQLEDMRQGIRVLFNSNLGDFCQQELCCELGLTLYNNAFLIKKIRRQKFRFVLRRKLLIAVRPNTE